MDWVPRSVRQKSKEVEEAIGRVEARLGRAASDEEVAKELGLSENAYNDTLIKISGTSVLSLNDVWYTGDENDKVSIVDSLESPAGLGPESEIEKDEIKRVIVEALKELPDKEKKVLILYYYEDLTLKEIGKVLEVTESRISQLHTKAVMRLRSKLTNVKKGLF
jgi:RNA polymerase sigma factor for flagellar operon FliA